MLNERTCKRCGAPLPPERRRSISDKFSWDEIGLCPSCLYDKETREMTS